MTDAYRVSWDPDARADLQDIVRFVAEERPIAARRVADRLSASAASLHHHPQRGRRPPELAALADLADLTGDPEIRELVVRPWRLIYMIAGRQVRIVAVVDSRRDMVAWLERHITRITESGKR